MTEGERKARKKQYLAEWRAKNRERDLENKKAHYAANSEKYRQRAKEYRIANLERVKEQKRRHYEANRAAILKDCRERRAGRPRGERERNYGLKPTGFTVALKRDAIQVQGGKCGICATDLEGLPEKQVHADHCHASGNPRGVLCGSCNHGLGKFKDNPAFLRAAIEYLANPPLGGDHVTD